MSAVQKEFSFTRIFRNVSNLEVSKYLYSPKEKQFNVPWQLVICHEEEHMGVYLRCLKSIKNNSWGTAAVFTLKLISSTGKCIEKSRRGIYFSPNTRNGWNDFISWDTMIKDYLIDEVIMIEGIVKIDYIIGVPKSVLKSFDKSNQEFSDVIIAVENRKFYVLKKFLASHSTYFKALFLGNFQEAEKSKVTLHDIDYTDFQNLLEVIHGESSIDKDTIEGILHLAHMYDMPFPTRKCEEFLIDLSEKSVKEKLKIAHKYQLEKLKNYCLSKIDTVDQIKAAMTGDPTEMDSSVLAALLTKSLALH